MRGAVAWLLTLPLALLGSQVAHKLVYLGVEPNHGEREHLLESTGHGYLEYAPIGAALVVALCAAAVTLQFCQALRGGGGVRLRAAPFALVPVATFASQEYFERLVHYGQFPLAAAFEPTFLLGIALQLPFALLAYVAARLLLHAARVLARSLGDLRPSVAPRGVASERAPLPVALPRPSALARGYAGRGPPLTV